MTCAVVMKEESTEISEISEPEIWVEPTVIDECGVSDRIYDYYLDELEENQADQVADHLENCPHCQEVYYALEKVVTTLKRDAEKFFHNKKAEGISRKKKSPPKAMEAAG